MKTKTANFEDVILAKSTYAQCEKFIRRVEEIGSFKGMGKYGVRDWWLVGYALSTDYNRRASFESYVNEQAKNKKDMQKRAYNWVMTCAAYENYTMWILECFRHAYITKDDENICWEGFVVWIKSKIRSYEDGTRDFVFFEYTDKELLVR